MSLKLTYVSQLTAAETLTTNVVDSPAPVVNHSGFNTTLSLDGASTPPVSLMASATVPKTAEMMKAAEKTFEPVTYDGAGHGFMRAGDAPPPPADADQKMKDAYAGNKKARDEAWKRWKALLKKM